MHSSQRMRPPWYVPALQPSTPFVTPHAPATPLPFREWAGLATLACSLHEKWACAPWRLVGAPTKSTWHRNSERTSTSMPRHRTRRQHCKGSEAQMSSLRPRQAGPQSVACFPALKLGANLWLSESQVMPSRSTAYRSSSADGQLSAVSPEERSRLKTRLISAYAQMSVQ